MKTTEQKYWSNGITKRGKDFYSLAFTLSNIGFLVCLSINNRHLSFEMFKLTK